MGYYTGSGVAVLKRKHKVCVATGRAPTYTVDGVPQGWYTYAVLRDYLETATEARGVQEPPDSALVSSLTVDGAGAVLTSTETSATRVGDSNLWIKRTDSVTSQTST